MIKKIINSLTLLGMSLGASFLGLTTASGAQSTPGTIPLPNPLVGQTDVFGVIMTILQWAIIIAGVVAVIYIIWGGYQYMTGGEDGVKAGRTTLSSAIVGLIIVLLAFVIVNTIQTRIFEVDVGSGRVLIEGGV